MIYFIKVLNFCFILRAEYENLNLLSAQTEIYPNDQVVTIEALLKVFHHGERQHGDTHRFAQTEDPDDFMSHVNYFISSIKENIIFKLKQRIQTIFDEINDEENTNSTLFSKLIAHPVLCEMISICTRFRAPDFRYLFVMQDENDGLAQDRKSPE